MTSVRQGVYGEYEKNSAISLAELLVKYPNASKKTIQNYLGECRNKYKGVPIERRPPVNTNRNFTRLDNDLLKTLVLDMLNGNLTPTEEKRLKIAIDFLNKVKLDDDQMEELEMGEFLKYSRK